MTKPYKIIISLLIAFTELNAQIPELWGTTQSGGAPNSNGTIFKVNGDSSGFLSLLSFAQAQGVMPRAGLLNGHNGYLYGVTSSGGNMLGVLFKIDTATNQYTKLFDFDYSSGTGPEETLLLDTNANLIYGTTTSGYQTTMWGTIFSYDLTTDSLSVLHVFSGSQSNPEGSLIMASNGKLYGMTYGAGAQNIGTIFKFDPSNNQHSIVYSFNGTDGANPQSQSGLFQANNGFIYGATHAGGIFNQGVLFKFNPLNNSYTKLYDFEGTIGRQPQMKLIQASNGLLYGTTTRGGVNDKGVLFSLNISNDTITKLFDFDLINATFPLNSLLQASDGKLYGVTGYGGVSNNGTVYSFDLLNNDVSIVHSFDGSDGQYPYSSLIELRNHPIGIENENEKINSVFPNPADQFLTIQSEQEFYFTIKNINGEQKNLPASKLKNKAMVDVSMLPSGIYFLSVYLKNKQINKKIIVSH